MSLINDALKRANQAQKQNAPARPKYTPLQPVDSMRRGFDWPALLLPGLLIVALLAGGGFLWAWLKSPKPSTPAPEVATVPAPVKVTSTPAAVQPPPQIPTRVVKAPEPVSSPAPVPVAQSSQPITAAPTQAEVVISTNIVVRVSPPASAPAAPPVQAPVPVASTPSPPAAAAVVAASPPVTAPVVPVQAAKPAVEEFPILKLQGILYRRVNPSAFINGKSCYVDDVVDKARVTRIERQSVFVEFNGQTKELNIEP